MIKNLIFLNIYLEYGWIFQTTLRTIRSDVTKLFFFSTKKNQNSPLSKLRGVASHETQIATPLSN